MKRNLRAWQALFVLVLCLVPAGCWADGMSFRGVDFSSLSPIVETEQRVVILPQNGREKMFIAVNLPLEDADKAVWILPVPGQASQVKLDLLKTFPAFRGRDPRPEADDELDNLFRWVEATQLWTLAPLAPYFFRRSLLQSGSAPVIFYGGLEKFGVRTEMLTADSAEALAAYLRQKKIGIQADHLRSFAPYLNANYLLIVTWIASRQELLKEFPGYQEYAGEHERWPCLLVDFPTDRIFYPLRPTSGYGDTPTQLRLYVIGFVEPQVSNALLDVLKVSYYRGSVGEWVHSDGTSCHSGSPKEFLGVDLPEPLAYTAIFSRDGKVGSGSSPGWGIPSRMLTEDLWLVSTEPLEIRYSDALHSLGNRLWWAIPLLVLVISYAAAGLAGLSLFGCWRGYAGLGLWNLLTLVGLVVAARRQPEEKWNGVPLGRRAFLRRFTLSFILICLLAHWALLLPLGGDFASPEFVGAVAYFLLAALWIVWAEWRAKRKAQRAGLAKVPQEVETKVRGTLGGSS